ncbi:hypothetical protein GCM10023189_40710 [Nibrella saemangeumensis]|uniref:NnrS protein n=1 Tax=Nibrella saemangeumensis TaxID=1084526 RepID=A0ABP8N8G6_9BACT
MKVLLLPFAILSLVVGLLTGLVRLGWAIPVTEAAGQHGALMVGSFLGTLIALERAVVFKNRWALLAPGINALSLPAFLLGQPLVAQGLLLMGSLGMVVMTYLFMTRYTEKYYYLLFGGSICLVIGHVLLLQTHFYPIAVPWWIAFLLLTITAERLELSRFLPVKPWQRNGLWGAVGLFLVGVMQPFHGVGQPLTGAGMLAIAAWLLRFDMAFKSIRKAGQPRYSGTLLIIGYGWLLVSGGLFLISSQHPLWYDAALHSFFLGFVFSMIFAHAPIILPGVMGRSGVLYHRSLYIWSVLSSVALGLRLAGAWLEWPQLRSVSGLLQSIVIILFFITILLRLWRTRLPSVKPRTGVPAANVPAFTERVSRT